MENSPGDQAYLTDSSYFSGMIRALILVLMVLTASCAKDSREESTRIMADSLALIAEKASPENYIYANTLVVDKLSGIIETVAYETPFTLRLTYIRHLIYAGRFEEGISELEKTIAARFTDGAVTPESRPYYELLALAYLRLGEQENCLINHTAESCLLPIRGEGVHAIRRGSENAIHYFQKLLESDPDDMQSRWLLNIAYMTLGEYPGEVPEEYLIPDNVFDSDTDFPRFHDRAIRLGVDHTSLAGGSVTEDFNKDGHMDIFVTSWGLTDQARLFLADGKGGFTDYTEAAGITGITSGLNAIQADYDNDGLTDILILRGGWLPRVVAQPNSLLKNLGNGRFRDVTREAGLYTRYPTQTAVWTDLNLDGHLDLFVGNEWFPSRVYINDQDGTFTDATGQWTKGIEELVKGVTAGDVNNDMRPDIYISTLTGDNMLLLNSGDELVDVAQEAGVTGPDMSFPCWFFDYDQDGLDDIFVAGYQITTREGMDMSEMFRSLTRNVALDYLGEDHDGESPRLYLNNGNGTFTNMSDSAGLNTVLYAMGSNFGDLNNDGFPDFYVGTGAPDFNSQVPNRMFLNDKGRKFLDVTTAGGFGQIQKGHGISWADLDNDGDQDIYTVIGGAMEGDVYGNMLYENPGFENNWIILRLEGTTANRSAIGARVEIVTRQPGDSVRTFYHRIGTGGSFGANSLQLEGGLGKALSIEEIRIFWPCSDPGPQVISGLEMNERYHIKQGQAPAILPGMRVSLDGTAHAKH